MLARPCSLIPTYLGAIQGYDPLEASRVLWAYRSFA